MAYSDEFKIFRAGLAAHLVRLELVGELLALSEAGHSGPLNRADVNEHIVAAVGRLDKAKALLPVEPLHNTCSHNRLRDANSVIAPARPPRRLQFNFSDVSGKEALAAITKQCQQIE